MKQPQISSDSIRSTGQIEAISISKILQTGDNSAAMFASELSKPLVDNEIELMLSNQAIVTNAIANRYLQQSITLAEFPQGLEMASDYMKLALKSFEISKKALVALNEIRNPKQSATFIKNQNNLLNQNQNHDKTLDTGRTRSTIPTNPVLETLETCRREN